MSKFLSVSVAVALVLLVIAAVTDIGLGTLLSVVWLPLGALALGAAAVSVVRAVARAGRRPVEWPDASVGVATVQSIRSSTELKDGRRLMVMSVVVEPADGSPLFESEFTRRVAAEAVAGVQPGLQFPAMYRVARREKVKIARGSQKARAQAFFDKVRVRDGWVQPAQLAADRNGVLAEADVLGIGHTDRRVGITPVFEVTLRILPLSGTPYVHRMPMPLSRFEHDLLSRTPRVRVKYLPDNPHAVAVAIEHRQEAIT